MHQICSDCGAVLTNNLPCETYFHQMLSWESEEPANWRVHHLMVLCYHLQHPAMYSPEGMDYSRWLLNQFVEEDQSPEKIRQQIRDQVASNNRNWKIKGTADSHASYDSPIIWKVNAANIIAGGIDNYCENVEKWAKTIHQQLKFVFD